MNQGINVKKSNAKSIKRIKKLNRNLHSKSPRKVNKHTLPASSLPSNIEIIAIPNSTSVNDTTIFRTLMDVYAKNDKEFEFFRELLSKNKSDRYILYWCHELVEYLNTIKFGEIDAKVVHDYLGKSFTRIDDSIEGLVVSRRILDGDINRDKLVTQDEKEVFDIVMDNRELFEDLFQAFLICGGKYELIQ